MKIFFILSVFFTITILGCKKSELPENKEENILEKWLSPTTNKSLRESHAFFFIKFLVMRPPIGGADLFHFMEVESQLRPLTAGNMKIKALVRSDNENA